jgi:glycosyltransferase involved in cell wall biosynthesis
MRPFGTRVRFLGALKETEMEKAYQRARILFWPGVNEAFGMTYLEAQATGLTVLAQDRPGVRDVLAPGVAYPAPGNGSSALAARLDMLLGSPKMVLHLGQIARSYVGANHLLDRACETLGKTVREVTR